MPSALAHPNIALIKYWGNRDDQLRLPSTGSISFNLSGLFTRTQVNFSAGLSTDELILDGEKVNGPALKRVRAFLDVVREKSHTGLYARVETENNFPMGTGIASSASAFAALALAASTAAGLDLSERKLSRLARLGSGSACRSIPSGFVEWRQGGDDETSYAYSIAPPDHWALSDCVAIVSQEHKPTGSSEGHIVARTSPVQRVREEVTPDNLDMCRKAILERDFTALAEVAELDCNLMHAVMMTSQPQLLYWEPATLEIMHSVRQWRDDGIPAFYTIDAGPNVHVICQMEARDEIARRLGQIKGVSSVLTAHPGGPTRLEFR
jgi:diphosphomevalonate decarboxylase